MGDFLPYFIDIARWLLGRPRLTVRIIEDRSFEDHGELTFEVENRGASVTSLKPRVSVKFYYPRKGRMEKGRNDYALRELDRSLPPFTPRILHGTPAERLDYYLFSWYRTYMFRPARGWRTKVHVRNAWLEPIGLWRYVIESGRLKVGGRVKDPGPKTIDDYKRMRQFRGPH